jgi:hypothetical protein
MSRGQALAEIIDVLNAEAYDRGRADDRAVVVEFLRKRATQHQDTGNLLVAAELRMLADGFEALAHGRVPGGDT